MIAVDWDEKRYASNRCASSRPLETEQTTRRSGLRKITAGDGR
jgi:hypothetical protein